MWRRDLRHDRRNASTSPHRSADHSRAEATTACSRVSRSSSGSVHRLHAGAFIQPAGNRTRSSGEPADQGPGGLKEATRRWEDYLLNKEDSLLMLPNHLLKLVRASELCTRAQVRAAIESGELWRDGKRGMVCRDHRRLNHACPETWALLHEWAGLPRSPVPKRVLTCPHCGKEIGM